MFIKQTKSFERTVKKLHKNQKAALDLALNEIFTIPSIGQLKKGDLSGVRVFKFQMLNQLMLLAYVHSSLTQILTLLALGTHENFYRDLKNQSIQDHTEP